MFLFRPIFSHLFKLLPERAPQAPPYLPRPHGVGGKLHSNIAKKSICVNCSTIRNSEFDIGKEKEERRGNGEILQEKER